MLPTKNQDPTKPEPINLCAAPDAAPENPSAQAAREGSASALPSLLGMTRTPTPDPTKPEPINLNYRRFKAALDLRGLGVEEVARQAGVSSRHVWFALRNERRPSAAVLAHIRAALGEHGWLFATGQTDTLRDDCPAGEMASHARS